MIEHNFIRLDSRRQSGPKFMRKYLYRHFIFCILLFSFNQVNATSNNVEILSSTSSEFHFIAHIDYNQLDCFENSDSTYTYYQSLLVGIPIGSNPTVSSVNKFNQIIIDKADKRGISRNSASVSVAELSQVKTVRGRQFVTVNLYPVKGEFYFQVAFTF